MDVVVAGDGRRHCLVYSMVFVGCARSPPSFLPRRILTHLHTDARTYTMHMKEKHTYRRADGRTDAVRERCDFTGLGYYPEVGDYWLHQPDRGAQRECRSPRLRASPISTEASKLQGEQA